MEDGVPEFEYVVAPLPPSRAGRRWGWQLWRGDRLMAAGWNAGERSACRALRTAASRAAHELAGVRALRPDRAVTDRPLLPGARVRVFADAAACLLVPRPLERPEASAA
jgi:hypothetical protein